NVLGALRGFGGLSGANCAGRSHGCGSLIVTPYAKDGPVPCYFDPGRSWVACARLDPSRVLRTLPRCVPESCREHGDRSRLVFRQLFENLYSWLPPVSRRASVRLFYDSSRLVYDSAGRGRGPCEDELRVSAI